VDRAMLSIDSLPRVPPTYYGNSSKAKKMKENSMNKNLSESPRTSDQYFMDIQQTSKIIREQVIDICEHLMKL
jgi:hypothetical protein